jgi:hypothetical protein
VAARRSPAGRSWRDIQFMGSGEARAEIDSYAKMWLMSHVHAREPQLARLTVDQVQAMVEAGILAEGEPIELLDGVLVYKDRSAQGDDPMTIGKRHNLVVKLLARLDAELATRGYHMQTQGPLRIPPYDEPEPDGLVLRGDPRAYADRLPEPGDVSSVIEVADASLVHDRTKKLAIYARAGLAQYIIVNLQESCIEVYEHPLPDEARYAEVSVVRAGQVVALRVGDERLPIAAATVLP